MLTGILRPKDSDLGFRDGSCGAGCASLKVGEIVVSFPGLACQRRWRVGKKVASGARIVNGRIGPSQGVTGDGKFGGVGIQDPGPDPGV